MTKWHRLIKNYRDLQKMTQNGNIDKMDAKWQKWCKMTQNDITWHKMTKLTKMMQNDTKGQKLIPKDTKWQIDTDWHRNTQMT
jgi:hypothetical protein